MRNNNPLKNQAYRRSLFLGTLFFLLAMIVTYVVVDFANTREGANSVGDLILDNAPDVNLFFFRVLLPLTSFLLAAWFLLKHPERLPAALLSIGLMYMVRAVFILVTYLEAHPQKTFLNEAHPFFALLPFQGNDLFFSGHVAFPLMMAFLFWDSKHIRTIFILLSISSGVVTLLSKAHYTIDVLAAPFISYGVFRCSEKLFGKDFERFKNS